MSTLVEGILLGIIIKPGENQWGTIISGYKVYRKGRECYAGDNATLHYQRGHSVQGAENPKRGRFHHRIDVSGTPSPKNSLGKRVCYHPHDQDA